jgi:hypothetical protein
MKDDIFQKISRFYYRTTAAWNMLIFWYVVVLMLYKNKNIVAKLKNQNGGLIQDGDNNFFFLHIINRHFNFVAWQHWYYFIIASELQHVKK